jgi:uracil phosphoribosyltransferase
MIMGRQLRSAHYQLGEKIGESILKHTTSIDFSIVIMMRAGLCFANGIADQMEDLGASINMVFVHNDRVRIEDLYLLANKKVVIVDAVINSGKSILHLMSQISQIDNQNIYIATTVIPEKALNIFEKNQLFTVRTSENTYKGAKVKNISDGKGPDTGDRLFNTY